MFSQYNTYRNTNRTNLYSFAFLEQHMYKLRQTFKRYCTNKS